MDHGPSTSSPQHVGRIPWCAAAALAVVHTELIDVFRSPFWPGLHAQDWAGIGAATTILFLVMFAAASVLSTLGGRIIRAQSRRRMRESIVSFVAPVSIAVLYIAHGDESTAKLAAIAVFAIATLWFSRFILHASSFHALFAIALTFAITYATAERLFAYPQLRAATVLWVAPATLIAAAFGLLLANKLWNRSKSQRRAIIASSAGAALLVLTVALAHAAAETRTQEKPNLVLITFDALRADYTSVYGGSVHTPAMQSLADRGVVFEHAYSLAPWTVPSMYGMFASQYPPALNPGDDFESWQAAAASYRFTPQGPTLAERLQQRGYATAAYIGNPLLGNRNGILRGFATARAWPAHSPLPTGPLAQLPGLRGVLERWFGYATQYRPIDSGAIVAKCARRFIADHPSEPFFIWVHFIDPHDPYDPPNEFRSQTGPWPLFSPISNRWGTPQLDAHGNIDVAPNDRAFVRSLYEGEIAYADRRLDEILQSVESANVGNRTVTCVTADHGEELWDHGRFGHGQSLYDELIRVPFLLAGGDIMQARVTNPVSAIDAMPTLADLMNVKADDAWRGRSLAAALRGEEPFPSKLCFAQATNCFAWPNVYRMARIGSMKLIQNQSDGSVQLYDLATDPNERRDRATVDATALRSIQEQFTQWVNSQPELSAPVNENTDSELIESLTSMGYID